MHFYTISFKDLRELPLPLFWEMCRNIDRIQADEDIRLFVLISQSWGGKGKDFINKLKNERGDIFESEAGSDFDKAGMARLRNKLGRR